MLTLDEQALTRWKAEQQREASRQLSQQAMADDVRSNTVTVEPDAGRDVSSILAQLGRPLSSQEVQTRLKRCNPRLHFEIANSTPTQTGVYLLTQEKTEANTWEPVKKFICGMETGMMPEFSVLHKTTKKVPSEELFTGKAHGRELDWKNVPTFLSETRGWRTVLIRLLHGGLITRLDVERHFGWIPSHDSKKWHERTK